MERGAGASMQQNQENSEENLMDEHLRANGLYRKRIAKDGSCLFRAVAEQVLHCQSLHTRVRAECVKYLRQKRDQYESFIEGDFEEYLHMLQDPQSWVGQVEISALAVLYKHDFIIYQQPGEPPVNITENGYPDKVQLCFLNGNHYDSVYPISSIKSTAMCQSILYELLYERVYGVDRNVLSPSLRGSKSKNDIMEAEEHESSGLSDLDEGEDFWSSEATGRPVGVNKTTYKQGRGRGQARGVGRGCLLRKVQESLNPSIFRNVEYEVWLHSERVQQRRDFCMAAGMHYKTGDKCQVRLNNTDQFYSAYIEEVSPDDGPVTVFIKQLGEKFIVPLWNLRTSSEESWSTVTEKSKIQTSSSSNGPSEHDTRPGRKLTKSVSHGPTSSSGSAPGSRIQQQHSWPAHTSSVEPQGKKADGRRRSDQDTDGFCVTPVEENEHALLELLCKDEENFPTLEASAQAASVEGNRRAEKKSSRRKGSTDTKEQSLTLIPKADRVQQAKKASVDKDQTVSPPPTTKEDLTPSAPKSTKAAPASTTAPARIPYKTLSSLSARISSTHSQTASPVSTRSTDSVQTTPVQSQTTRDTSARKPDSVKTTRIQSPTAPSTSSRPPDSAQAQSAPDNSKVIPSETTPLVHTQTPPLPAMSVPNPVTSHQTNLLPQNRSAVTTPMPLNPLPEATTTPIPSQPTTVNLSPSAPAPNPVTAPLSLSSSQYAPPITHALSQTSSATTPGPVPALSQTTPATEVPPLRDLSALSESPSAFTPSDSAGVVTPVHSITPTAQPASSLAPSYPVEFGNNLPYPPYSPYPAPVPSLSPNISGPVSDACHPPAVTTPSFPHSAEPYLYQPAVSPVAAGAGGVLVPDPPPQPSVTLEQLCQDMLYPGFPQNDKGEPVQHPPFSCDRTGKDLPSDTSVLRFFFNLGLKAYLYRMFAPVTYLVPLVQAYRHMQMKVSPSPSWQPDTNSRPIFASPNPPLPPVIHFEASGMVRTPSPMEGGVFSHHSLPMQMPPPVTSRPTLYAGMRPVPPAGPSLQYPAPPPALGPQHLSVATPQHYGIEIPMSGVPPIMELGQHHTEGGDVRSGTVPVTVEIQHGSGVQNVKGEELPTLANGNRQEKCAGFVGSSAEDLETEKAEFVDAELKSGGSYHGRSYKSGSKYSHDDRGGYRGRGFRGRRVGPGWGRHDGQVPYYRGSGGRNRGRNYINHRSTGNPGGQFAPAPES